MRHPEANLPSFTFVLDQAQQQTQVPTIRYSHVLRFKPYARPPLRSRRDVLMTTIDERDYDDDFTFFPASNQGGSAALNLHGAIHGNSDRMVAEHKLGVRLRFTTLDLALLVVRKLRLKRNVDL